MHRTHMGALALCVFVLAPLAPAQVRLQSTPSGSTLALEGGASLRATDASVSDLRAFHVPGSAAVAANWRETNANGTQWYYAISLDGRTPATVRPTSYELEFRRARFDPLQTLPSFTDSSFAGGGNVYVVQYLTQPLIEYSAALTASGAQVFDYVLQHSHIVRMSKATRASVATLPFVRWIGEYHPEFRVDPDILAELQTGTLAPARYNVQVFERGLEEQQIVAEAIARMGGEIHLLVPEGFRFEATLTPAMLVRVAAMDQVRFIDRWSEPGADMDIVRQVGGANYVSSVAGFDGQGVRGEVMDVGTDLTHPDLTNHVVHGSVPFGEHGTCTAGIVFGSGVGNAQGKGMLPQGTLVAAYYQSFGGGTRYSHTGQLVNPSLTYQCVFQSNSWGGGLTTQYTTTSGEMDDLIADHDIVILQSQSNANSTSSRPEAWAKNIVSVGGINHQNNASYVGDTWGGASIGPAADGRLKPDLAFFYDSIFCPDGVGGSGYVSGNYYDDFGGTSAATPETAGHFGIFFQMWHAGVFGNTPGASTVFAARPHFTLAKAAMINTATQWTFSGSNHNLTRTHQGWGHANLQTLYDRRGKTFFVDQTDVVNNLGSVSYNLNVAAGEPDLRITMVYRDAMGAVSSSQHRKNDLTLVVTAPDSTVYYGNNGLAAGNWSTPGGSANNKDTVENVLIQNPLGGTWVVQVRGDDINTDPVTTLPATTADFALWATGVTLGPVCPQPLPYCTAKLTSGFSNPAIGSQGVPSVGGSGFEIKLSNALPNKSAIVFYGFSPHSAPFHAGVLCVQAPVVRSPIQQTDGASAASYSVPMNPAMVGTTRYYQWWFRDPQDSFGDGLSNALQVQFCD